MVLNADTNPDTKHHTQVKGSHSGEQAHNSMSTFRLLSKKENPKLKISYYGDIMGLFRLPEGQYTNLRNTSLAYNFTDLS